MSRDFKGSKYAETKDLDLAEIAKLVRADIKAAVKAGDLPKGTKTSVRISRYSMGQSLTATITECPGLIVANPDRVRFDLDDPHGHTTLPLLSPDATRVVGVVQDITDSYNYDSSDPASDYYNVRFYGGAGFCSEFEERSRDEIRSRFETEAEQIEAANMMARGLRSIGFEIERQETAKRIAEEKVRRAAEKKAKQTAAVQEGVRRAATAEAARAEGMGDCEPSGYEGRPRIAWIETESESPALNGRVYGSINELSDAVRAVARERIAGGRTGGYHKTWLTITWDDGETGQARYDVNARDVVGLDLSGTLLRMWSRGDSAKALEISRERVVA
ncbi:MAG: hypothetical protein E3J64_07045 [Anaerolineales bacterium]|nr:MAG: hypothetical protein E3J64_07045 [Anaerolineales bacterium]